MARKKKKKIQLNRITMDSIIPFDEGYDLNEITFATLFRNRNREQVCDALWEDIIVNHVNQSRYN
jgi:hypothetical protein